MNDRPVIAGVHQLSFPAPDGPENEPLELLSLAVDGALEDAGPALASYVDVVYVLRSFWPYRAPAAELAGRFGFPAGTRRLAPPSGNHAQALINDAANRIARGEARAAVVVGAEASFSAARARRDGQAPTYRTAADDLEDELFGEGEFMRGAAEAAAGVTMPAPLYAMIESALRQRVGLDVEAHRLELAQMAASFAEVAARNPFAWHREGRSAERLLTIDSDNRMVAAPYSTRMMSDWTVDQAAAVLLCAEALVPRAGGREAVHLRSGVDSFAVHPVSERVDIASRPQVAAVGRCALDLAGLDIEQIEAIDLYSCFPAAVKVQAAELRIPGGTQLTLTGGMAFAGGPVNSYALHSMATAVERIRQGAATALVTSVGGVLDKQSISILCRDRPAEGFQHQDLTGECAVAPRRTSVPCDGVDGDGEVVGATATFGRDGATALFLVELDGNRRTIVPSDDGGLVSEVQEVETVGRKVALRRGRIVSLGRGATV